MNLAHPSKSMRRRQVVRNRNGLTLLEVLLSIGLSALLLSAVYSAIHMYFRLSNAGYEEIERTQLARVVLSKIERDLRSLVYRPEDVAAAESSSSSSTSSSSTSSSNSTSGSGSTSGSSTNSTSSSTTTEIQDPADAYETSASGLNGNESSLVIHVSRPSLKLLSQSQLSLQSRTSDLKTVAYFLAGQGGGGLQAAAAASFASRNKDGPTTGLSRLEGERLTLQLADKQGDLSSLVGQTELLAHEVTKLQFRYFDGAMWVTSWDSYALGALPTAVEITVEVRFDDETKGRGLRKRTIHDVARTYRRVVALPIAQSYMLSTSTTSGSSF